MNRHFTKGEWPIACEKVLSIISQQGNANKDQDEIPKWLKITRLLLWMWSIQSLWEYKIIWPLWKAASHFWMKLNMYLSYDPVFPFLTLLPKERNVSILQKDLFKNVHINFIYKSPRLETTQMSINIKMEKLLYTIQQ